MFKYCRKYISVVIMMALATTLLLSVVPAVSETSEMTLQQKNAINMLNYLRATAQEIRSSKNSRLYLENAYSELINNTRPNAIDPATLSEVMDLLDTLENYRMLSVKRERLQYIYEQNQAQAIRDAVPNPLGLMSAVQSFSLAKLAASIVYMAVDAKTSYDSSMASADLKFLQDGWALDDEEAANLHESRKELYAYMVTMTTRFSLEDKYTLNEEMVDDFVSWQKETNTASKIQYFESNIDTYRAFGPYWLTLAEAYYDHEDYSKCLDAIAKYESLDIQIFRNDYDYAQVLPLGILSAAEVLPEDEFVAKAQTYIQGIIDNTTQDNWDLRYFAAQICVDLYAKTQEQSWLKEAYNLALNNVNSLVNKQKDANNTYMADVKTVDAGKGATKAQKDEAKNYNKMLNQARKVELAPINEPLLLNCELLFALADQLSIDDNEKGHIDAILHGDGERIFLPTALDERYRFSAVESYDEANDVVAFNGKEIIIPARYVTVNAKITVNIKGDTADEFSDWVVSKVERKDKKNFDSFLVTYKSGTAGKFGYEGGQTVTVTIIPWDGADVEPIIYKFNVERNKRLGVLDTWDWLDNASRWSDDLKFTRVE